MFLKRALTGIILITSIMSAIDLRCDGCNLFGRKPVCGMDGNTYLNRCYAMCNDIRVGMRGQCRNCKCNQYYEPICASNGQTYANPCEARCNGASVQHAGRCDVKNCNCENRGSDPVCAMNGKTFRNECEAQCQGENVDYFGVCGSCKGGNCRNEVYGGYHDHPSGVQHYGYM